MTTGIHSNNNSNNNFKLLKTGIEIAGWNIITQNKPILRSTEKDEWEESLKLNSLPEMIYGNNFIRLSNQKISMIFNAHDALKLCPKESDESIKVSYAKKWQEINKSTFEGTDNNEPKKKYDWTYSTTYKGTIIYNDQTILNETPIELIEATEEQINIEKLKRPVPILFYDDILLYEDELADNGTSILSVKIRVMNDSFFLLLRYYLRVDDVIVRAYDTRIYHEFDKSYLLREFSVKETNFDTIKHLFEKDPSLLTNSDFIVTKLPTVSTKIDKILIK
ncbi:hypothetical protein DLAC_07849 [Tieghemostelium lacteum]|uniref:TIP41-like protein n=1 Tax=Tieghemostelium lacteum TaxID=361077 RepID=A0A151ZAK0_TIELA|nr:hypothetical protein DLAC_07849 [Tieghemostelium lacteum]|eukprot:KYQ90965.1 hypothetical protein DLAC_07849 [Tieghemostelium lacteum]